MYLVTCKLRIYGNLKVTKSQGGLSDCLRLLKNEGWSGLEEWFVIESEVVHQGERELRHLRRSLSLIAYDVFKCVIDGFL